MLGNFNANFDQWLIRATDKAPYEKRISIAQVQELKHSPAAPVCPERCQPQLSG